MGVVVRFQHVHDRCPEVVLGPFPFVQLTYTLLRAGQGGDCLAHVTQSGTWEIGLDGQALKRYGTQYDGQEYTDVIVEDVPDVDFTGTGTAPPLSTQ